MNLEVPMMKHINVQMLIFKEIIQMWHKTNSPWRGWTLKALSDIYNKVQKSLRKHFKIYK